MGNLFYFAAVKRIDASGADISVIVKYENILRKGDIVFASNENLKFYGVVQAVFCTYEASEETEFIETVFGDPFQVEKRYSEDLL